MKITIPGKPKPLQAMKSYFLCLEIHAADLVMVLIAIILLISCWVLRIPFSEAFSKTMDISYGYSAAENGRGLYYVVDDGHSRILCFDKASALQSTLVPKDEEGNDLYIDNFAVQDDSVYIAASVWNGMQVGKEVIVEYQGDKYVRTVTERDYREILVNKHRFYGICVKDGSLSYAECEDNAIVLHYISLQTGEERTQRLFYDNAFNAVSDCAFHKDAFYILDKSGVIIAVQGDERSIVYSTQWDGEEEHVPFRLAIAQDGTIYFTDIRFNQIVQAVPEEEYSVVLLADAFSQTIGFTADGQGMLCLEEDGLWVRHTSLWTRHAAESEHYLSLAKPASQVVMQIVWLVLVALLALVALALLARLLISFLKREHSTSQMISSWVICTVAVVSFILCGTLLSKFSTIYRERFMHQIENSALVMASHIPKGALSEINLAQDFDNPAYRDLCDAMEDAFPMEVEFNRQIYCNILKLSEDGESAFSIAYLDQSIGSYFPLDEIETDEVIKLYSPENNGEPVWNDNLTDVSGTYISVKVPIYQAGEICGVVAVGSETYVIQEMIANLQIQILFNTVIILLLIWLTITELMAWIGNKEKYDVRTAQGDTATMPGHLIRLLVFAVFVCYNLSATFLPVWILRNSGIFPESLKDFMASLPITVNIFVIGIMSLFTANAVRRLGIRRILIISTACSATANLIMFLFPSYLTVFIGLFIDGIGVGLIANAMYVMLTYIKNEDDRQLSFTLYNTAHLSGMNFGMISGSSLAVLLGQRTVFVIIAFVWFVLMVMGALLVRQLQGILEPEDELAEAEAASGEASAQADGEKIGKDAVSVRRFLLNKPVLSFIVLFQNPYIVFNSFVFFFVPLFCEKMGYQETIASLMIVLYSEVAVLTGDLLTKQMTKSLGNYGMYAALATNIAALMVFAFSQNTTGVVLALLLMGTAAAYGKPLQQTWFLKQKQVQEYGEDKSMGVYNFSENIGESLGPIVFSSLMSQSALFRTLSVFCGGILSLAGGHLALNRKELKELK